MSSSKVKSTWAIGTETQAVHEITMLEPRTRPCNDQCPWLAANHDKTAVLYYDHEVAGIEMPENFSFATWKRADIWRNDLRSGRQDYGSLCHVRLKGTELTHSGTWKVISRQCTGALVMQQRELIRHVIHGESALTSEGAALVATDLLGVLVTEDDLPRLDVRDLLARTSPSLLDQTIQCEVVTPPLTEHEIFDWSLLRGSPP